jgi:hypothetical protein
MNMTQRAEMVARMRQLREQAIAKGMKLKSLDEINAELGRNYDGFDRKAEEEHVFECVLAAVCCFAVVVLLLV